MKALVCDICGGPLRMDLSGQFALCEFCGMHYETAVLKETFHRIQIDQEPQVSNWKALADAAFDNENWKEARYYAGKVVEFHLDDWKSRVRKVVAAAMLRPLESINFTELKKTLAQALNLLYQPPGYNLFAMADGRLTLFCDVMQLFQARMADVEQRLQPDEITEITQARHAIQTGFLLTNLADLALPLLDENTFEDCSDPQKLLAALQNLDARLEQLCKLFLQGYTVQTGLAEDGSPIVKIIKASRASLAHAESLMETSGRMLRNAKSRLEAQPAARRKNLITFMQVHEADQGKRFILALQKRDNLKIMQESISEYLTCCTSDQVLLESRKEQLEEQLVSRLQKQDLLETGSRLTSSRQSHAARNACSLQELHNQIAELADQLSELETSRSRHAAMASQLEEEIQSQQRILHSILDAYHIESV